MVAAWVCSAHGSLQSKENSCFGIMSDISTVHEKSSQIFESKLPALVCNEFRVLTVSRCLIPSVFVYCQILLAVSY
eukprot:85282-Amphidinium_carterae.1